jgi:uncharacterized Zn-binding protein involved in type VI secretion
MTARGVARVGQDKAGGLIALEGAKTVFTNNKNTAIQGSVVVGKPNNGDVIVASPASNVFVENKRIAVQGASTARGFVVQRGSDNVFTG